MKRAWLYGGFCGALMGLGAESCAHGNKQPAQVPSERREPVRDFDHTHVDTGVQGPEEICSIERAAVLSGAIKGPADNSDFLYRFVAQSPHWRQAARATLLCNQGS